MLPVRSLRDEQNLFRLQAGHDRTPIRRRAVFFIIQERNLPCKALPFRESAFSEAGKTGRAPLLWIFGLFHCSSQILFDIFVAFGYNFKVFSPNAEERFRRDETHLPTENLCDPADCPGSRMALACPGEGGSGDRRMVRGGRKPVLFC